AYCFDRGAGAILLVNHQPGLPATTSLGGGAAQDVSADGHFFVFADNGFVSLYDRLTDSSVLVDAVPGTGIPPTDDKAAGLPGAVSADGNLVTFVSTSALIIPNFSGPAGQPQVYLYERATGVTTLVSHATGSAAAGANDWSDTWNGAPALSTDGRYLV